ncbi:hypothetical protein [Mycobacterium avium]
MQFEWSLFSREPERKIVCFADELDIAVLAYSPRGRGTLA